ncbi:cytochrome B [Burkholderia stagnalis]|uniref:Cytochrome B n=2 Tax=Burkholderia stagnalis TaxID=1503054 RepID=A0A125KG93_9BURK|nr:cytochrome B [Burkholderia stagnalis]KWA45981.1 cytochrome B [Burkholderia stagnalis]KWA52400.1 cytochrome B [Burkholderia stagnalis]KWA62001.1 cytochrome B [Burkholderia stagnalis]KWC90723.1 cytochrome B [Burkholderia stagnalis]
MHVVSRMNSQGASSGDGRYDRFSRALHWIFAAVILYTMAAGFSLHFITQPDVWRFVSTLNMSLASCLIVLFPLRYVWSFFRRTPPDVQSIPPAQRSIAHLVHSLIYALVAFVLFSGFVMVPDGYWLFGVFYVKTLFSAGPVTEHWFDLHRIGCYALAFLVAAHAAAALKHHFASKNGVLKRML